MDLINRIQNVLNKHQTRQQLKNLTEAQLTDIGKSQGQVKEELLKSSLKHSLKNKTNLSFKDSFVGKMNNMLRSVK